MAQVFDLGRVNKSGAKFDPEKNKWFNHQYLMEKSNDELAEMFLLTLEQKGIQKSLIEVSTIVGLVKDRANFVTDLYNLADYFFVAPTEYDAKVMKNFTEDTKLWLQEISNIIATIENFEAKVIEEKVKSWITEQNIGMGKVMQPLRVAMVGEMKGPDLFEIMNVLGQEEVNQRIKAIIEK